jgi:ubiquinone/menaquinone biosynthesis C-methylase UbiE
MVVRRGAELLIEAMDAHLGGRVLDIGCGLKAKRHLVNDRVTAYVGLDQEGSLHGSSQVDLVGTAYRVPQPDEAFDGVVCTAVLEHLEEPKAALAESLRVLRRGGHAIYTVPLFWHLHEEPRDFYRYTKHGLRHLFEAVGYEIVEIKPASGFWITFGSEWSYYLSGIARGPFRFLARLITAANNVVFPLLDKIDRRFNRQSESFSWMYLVVARRPA